MAHPALWTVKGKHGTAYLLGSLYFVPPELAWRNGAIDAAINASDVFVFMGPADRDAFMNLANTKGTLPSGQSLRAMLPPQSQADLDADTAYVGAPEALIDNREPWLAGIVLNAAFLQHDGLSPISTVDAALQGEAHSKGKDVRYLETVQQQLALTAPDDPAIQLDKFESDLKNFKNVKAEAPLFVAAWAADDQDKLTALEQSLVAGHPLTQKVSIDDRNALWVKEIETMVDTEDKTFFITVGATHLLGDKGVPALLTKDGYDVQKK
jgi:hypothetical protein